MLERTSRKLGYVIGPIALLAFFLLLVEHSGYFDAYGAIFRRVNLVILALFALDVAVSFLASRDRLDHLKHKWFDLVVFVPLVQFFHAPPSAALSVVVRQVVVVAMLISRTRKIHRFISLLSLKPAQLMLTSFTFAIGAGTVLLMLPAATVAGDKTSFIDALFTATSATCVTGLIVRDTATHFSLFGQLVILGLIQIGGLGIMTFSVSLALILRKQVQMKQQVIMQDVLDQNVVVSVKHLLFFIAAMTVAFECIGAALLFGAWRGRFGSAPLAAYHAVFHSISAFCNAGFSTFSDSLMQFSGDVPTNVVIGLLILGGGIGFGVIQDLHGYVKNKLILRRPAMYKFRIQTCLVLTVSLLLVAVGFVLVYALERNHAFAGHSGRDRVLLAFFQSVTARTAGFNSCDIAGLGPATLFLIILLMFIGASPGSTGGGIKTTTVAVLWATIRSGLRQQGNVEICKRTLAMDTVQRAVTVFASAIALVSLVAGVLLYTEKQAFLDILFETVSAFGTVGLSTGVTPTLTAPGKLLITLLMFVGRLGPLTIGYAFSMLYRRPARYVYAEEKIMIG